jgi:hypothetical protein
LYGIALAEVADRRKLLQEQAHCSGEAIALDARATMSNQSGATYHDAFESCPPPAAMPAAGRPEERRRVGRPRNGDTKPCPKCAASMCDFNDRYRVAGAGVVPAWICDSPACRYREVVRRADHIAAARPFIRNSRAVRTGARRLMMKALFLVRRPRTYPPQSAAKKA